MNEQKLYKRELLMYNMFYENNEELQYYFVRVQKSLLNNYSKEHEIDISIKNLIKNLI